MFERDPSEYPLHDEYRLHDEALNEAFNSLKANKSPNFDDISPTVVKRCHEDIFNPINPMFLASH